MLAAASCTLRRFVHPPGEGQNACSQAKNAADSRRRKIKWGKWGKHMRNPRRTGRGLGGVLLGGDRVDAGDNVIGVVGDEQATLHIHDQAALAVGS